MVKNDKKSELTIHERTEYTVIKVEEQENYTVTTLRTACGATVICREPKHTPEELAELGASICRACVRLVKKSEDPNYDLSHLKHMEIIV